LEFEGRKSWKVVGSETKVTTWQEGATSDESQMLLKFTPENITKGIIIEWQL